MFVKKNIWKYLFYKYHVLLTYLVFDIASQLNNILLVQLNWPRQKKVQLFYILCMT